MRNCLKTIISISAVVSVLGLNSSVFGVAAFARQTGLDCTSCHASVGFPTLNTFGQAFKAGGYVNGDDANMMGDGEALSIPKNLNGSIVFKARASYVSTEAQKTGATTTETKTHNEIDMPDEWAFLFGGRVAKNIGYLVEYSGSALSFKLPIVFDLAGGKLGVVPFWTDGLGAGYGFENLSTGAVRNIRAVEERKVASAVSYVEGKIGDANGLAAGATGVTAYYWMGIAHVAVTGYVPASSEQVGPGIVDARYAQYIRAAVTPSLGGLDMAIGVQKTLGSSSVGSSGESPCVDTTTGSTTQAVDACSNGHADLGEMNYLGVDAQVMGTLGLPVSLFVTYGQSDNKTKANGDPRNGGVSASAFTVVGDVQLIENRLNVALGARLGKFERTGQTVNALGTAVATASTDEVSDNAILAEVKFNLARNMRISVDYSKQISDLDDFATAKKEGIKDSTSRARVMLFGSF